MLDVDNDFCFVATNQELVYPSLLSMCLATLLAMQLQNVVNMLD